MDNVINVGEVARLLSVAENRGPASGEHLGDEFGNDGRVLALGILPRTWVRKSFPAQVSFNPVLYLNYLSDISSMEHLYRDHLIYPCARCGAVSRKPNDLTKHLPEPELCVVIDWKPTFDRAQGFDDQQEKDIR